jgi:hypothetical protein
MAIPVGDGYDDDEETILREELDQTIEIDEGEEVGVEDDVTFGEEVDDERPAARSVAESRAGETTIEMGIEKVTGKRGKVSQVIVAREVARDITGPSAIETSDRNSRHEWDRLPQESPKAYAAFNVYRNLEPRERTTKVAAELFYGGDVTEATIGTLGTWSRNYSCVARALAWDEWIRKAEDEERIKAVREMRSRHATLAKMIQKKALDRLRKMIPEELSVEDVLDYLVAGIKIEKQINEAPIDQLQQADDKVLELQDFSQMSTEELREALSKRVLGENKGSSGQPAPGIPELPATVEKDTAG